MDAFEGIRAATPQLPRTETTPTEATSPRVPFASLADRATEAIREADQLQKDADREVGALAVGEGSTVETMVALSKADLSLRLVVALRNRALEAYQTLMRMQV